MKFVSLKVSEVKGFTVRFLWILEFDLVFFFRIGFYIEEKLLGVELKLIRIRIIAMKESGDLDKKGGIFFKVVFYDIF